MDFVPARGFCEEHAATAELDVIRVRADREDARA
jgi:hypothetical protein